MVHWTSSIETNKPDVELTWGFWCHQPGIIYWDASDLQEYDELFTKWAHREKKKPQTADNDGVGNKQEVAQQRGANRSIWNHFLRQDSSALNIQITSIADVVKWPKGYVYISLLGSRNAFKGLDFRHCFVEKKYLYLREYVQVNFFDITFVVNSHHFLIIVLQT